MSDTMVERVRRWLRKPENEDHVIRYVMFALIWLAVTAFLKLVNLL